MRLSIICFTSKGYEQMRKLNKELMADTHMYIKCKALKDMCEGTYVEASVEEWASEQFAKGRGIIFIGAVGIAVRAIASSVTDKLSDSPVIVMDDGGSFVIPVLSGHMGGANALAQTIAEKIKAVPVITTSTDINGKFAIDIFAKNNGLSVMNKEKIAAVSSKVLDGKPVRLCFSSTLKINMFNMMDFTDKYKNVISIERVSDDIVREPADVYIGNGSPEEGELFLCPKRYVLGIGCRRGKSREELETFIYHELEKADIDARCVCAVVSIDVKKDEEGLNELAEALRVPFETFSAEELNRLKGEFSDSEFVREQVGCGCVSERAALKGSGKGGRLVLPKQARDGITLAAAEKEWRLEFNE